MTDEPNTNRQANRLRPLPGTKLRSPTRRGLLTIETICACGLIFAMFGILAVTLHGIGTARRALLRRTMAKQTLANAIELIESWPADANTAEKIETLKLPDWSSQNLPKGELTASLRPECDLPGGLQAIQVAIAWSDRPTTPKTRLECMTWKPSESP